MDESGLSLLPFGRHVLECDTHHGSCVISIGGMQIQKGLDLVKKYENDWLSRECFRVSFAYGCVPSRVDRIFLEKATFPPPVPIVLRKSRSSIFLSASG